MFALCLWPGMYWTNSYSGGSVAASGGALVLLAMGIYRKKPKPYAGLIFVLGALLLFWTRPFEGGVFTLIVLIVFAQDLWRNRGTGAFVAAVLLLTAGGMWMCYYNQAVTGNPFLLPYLLHDHQYSVAPVLWLLPLRPEPTYSHPRLIGQHGIGGFEVGKYQHQRRVPPWQLLRFAGGGFILSFWSGLYDSVRPLTTSLAIPVLLTLIVPVAWRDPIYKKMAIVAGVFLLALICETFHKAHYTAPVWAAAALMVALWAERVWDLRVGKLHIGAALVVLSLTSPASTHLPSYVLQVLQGNSGLLSDGSEPPRSPYGIQRRTALIERLSLLDRPQLVIVRYPSPEWKVDEEWVYNGADIDRQQVVFAHDLGEEQDLALLRYYSDRKAMLLTFDRVSGREQIEPYPVSP